MRLAPPRLNPGELRAVRFLTVIDGVPEPVDGASMVGQHDGSTSSYFLPA